MIYKGKCGQRWHLTEKMGDERYYECPKHHGRMTRGYCKIQLQELHKICDECLEDEIEFIITPIEPLFQNL